MKILITGVNGFIGRYLAAELIKKGNFVIGLGRSKKCVVDKVGIYYSGSVLDMRVVEKAVKDADVVVHLAALTSHKDIIDNKLKTLDLNLQGTKSILEDFLKSNKSKKFIYSSTGKVYGKIMRLPISENHQTEPLNILGKSKLIAEKLIDFYNDSKKEFIIFRIFNVYGPGQAENFLIPTIINQLAIDSKVSLGDINARRDYVYIDDLINAFILAIEKKGKPGLSVYNICSGIGTSAKQIIDAISEIKGYKIKINSDKKLIRRDEMPNEYGSYKLIKNKLDWQPKYSLKSGLRKLIEQN